jgi:hypothetical protein
MTEDLARIEEVLWPGENRRGVWMVADAARDRRIFPLLLACHLEYSCLYSGPLPPALEAVAPYLIQLDYEYRDTRTLIRQAWGNSWGIFLKSDVRMEHLRKHLRRFLTVRDPKGGKLVFRYYDPRVLRVFLPACTRTELRALFGPVERFWLESAKPRTLAEFRVAGSGLVERSHDLDVPGPVLADEPPVAAVRDEPPRQPFTIRQGHVLAFARRDSQNFEDWMTAHVQRVFPQAATAMPDTALRQLIRTGIDRAAASGIKSKRDVCKYIDLMLLLGDSFESDDRFPWAAKILGRQEQPETKMRDLIETVQGHLRWS